MARKINQTGLDFIQQWEGLRTTAYQCPAGVWTIGYGHTAAAGKPVPKQDMKITKTEAEDILMRDLDAYEQAVETAVRASLTNNQFAALVSFAYNIGIPAFRKSTLLKKLNAGDHDAVPTELMKWVHAGGKRVQGLANRRAAEAGLWAKGSYVTSRDVQAKPRRDRAILTPEVIGPAVGAAAGLTGFADGNGPFQWALATIMVIACLAGAWYFIRRVRRESA